MKSDKIDISLDLTLDELCCLLGMVDQTAEADLRGLPKKYILTVKSVRSKLHKMAKEIEAN